jgi:hypothetical protein
MLVSFGSCPRPRGSIGVHWHSQAHKNDQGPMRRLLECIRDTPAQAAIVFRAIVRDEVRVLGDVTPGDHPAAPSLPP